MTSPPIHVCIAIIRSPDVEPFVFNNNIVIMLLFTVLSIDSHTHRISLRRRREVGVRMSQGRRTAAMV